MHATSREARLAALREQVRDIESAGRAAGERPVDLGDSQGQAGAAGGAAVSKAKARRIERRRGMKGLLWQGLAGVSPL
ncbi:MAG TPA: hypothetical protein VM422_03210, partial [Amaricoccus sp.]|nr:hypothetical protein [Amaricoccus sp.]